MNLIEAIKSCRPRRNTASYFEDVREWHNNADRTVYCVSDICADSWEIKEPEVTITQTQFWDAAMDIIRGDGYFSSLNEARMWASAMERVARKLGLEVEP